MNTLYIKKDFERLGDAQQYLRNIAASMDKGTKTGDGWEFEPKVQEIEIELPIEREERRMAIIQIEDNVGTIIRIKGSKAVVLPYKKGSDSSATGGRQEDKPEVEEKDGQGGNTPQIEPQETKAGEDQPVGDDQSTGKSPWWGGKKI